MKRFILRWGLLMLMPSPREKSVVIETMDFASGFLRVASRASL
jgi:hypothetical protein